MARTREFRRSKMRDEHYQSSMPTNPRRNKSFNTKDRITMAERRQQEAWDDGR